MRSSIAVFFLALAFVIGWKLTTPNAEAQNDLTIPKKVTLPACSASNLGAIVSVGGDRGLGGGVSKLCICSGIGAGRDAGQANDTGPDQPDSGTRTIPFKWCSLALSDSATLSCSTGTATSCP